MSILLMFPYNSFKRFEIFEKQYTYIPIHEALREKVELLGRFQGILLKFHILKIKFLHEKKNWCGFFS